MKLKLIKNWKKSLKSYSFLSIAANLLTAVSVSALGVLGVLSSDIAFPVLACLAVTFGLVGAVGRFIDQELDNALAEEDKDVQ